MTLYLRNSRKLSRFLTRIRMVSFLLVFLYMETDEQLRHVMTNHGDKLTGEEVDEMSSSALISVRSVMVVEIYELNESTGQTWHLQEVQIRATLYAAAGLFNVVTSVGLIMVNKALMDTYGFSFCKNSKNT